MSDFPAPAGAAPSTVLSDARPGRSTLATPEQLAAEEVLPAVLADPRVRRAVAAVEADLAKDPAAATAEGRGLLNGAVEAWAVSLAFRELLDRQRPGFLLAGEDTPRRWYGHDVPGAAACGDNPDNVYRSTRLAGDGRYEVRGRVPPNGPAQFSFELVREAAPINTGAHTPDLGDQVQMLADTHISVDPDGGFVITLDAEPAADRTNHIQLPPGPLRMTCRNTLSDWRQEPVRVSIRRVDASASAPRIDADTAAERVAANLSDYVAYWTTFKEAWLGGPAANVVAKPVPRDGGWGYLAGTRFELADDEGLLITTTTGGAKYTSAQMSDRWFVTPNSREVFTSLNNTQSIANDDGSVTYVLSPKDPGVANWISTNGLREGFLILRWQQVPANIDPDQLLKTAKLVKLPELQSELPARTLWVTPAERAASLQRRAAEYDLRLTSGS